MMPIKITKEKNADVLICDTAGRSHNKKYLMDELGKKLKSNTKRITRMHQKKYYLY